MISYLRIICCYIINTIMDKENNRILDDFLEQYGTPYQEQYIDKNLRITEQIYDLLKAKNWTQKDLAKALGKSPAEISKWLSGTHNFTLKSITKIEVVFGTDIIVTPQQANGKHQIPSSKIKKRS